MKRVVPDRYHVHDSGGEAAELGGIAISDYAKLADGVWIWRRVARVTQACHVGPTVQVVAHGSGAAIV